MVSLLAVVLTASTFAKEKPEPVAVKKLPVFAKGKWKGLHAVYSHTLFDATIDAKGVLNIKPKDAKGKYVGKPFTCYQLSCYYVPPKSHHKGRPVVLFYDPREPTNFTKLRDKSITIKGMLKHDVPFELFYEFKNNQITAAGGCEDPKGIAYPTNFRILCRMSRSHDIPYSMEQEDREKTLKGCIVKTRERVGKRKKTFKYLYHDIMKFHGNLEFVEVKGAYGPRIIQMKPRHQEGLLRGYIYNNFCPWQGFSIYYLTQGREINLKKNRTVMIVK